MDDADESLSARREVLWRQALRLHDRRRDNAMQTYTFHALKSRDDRSSVVYEERFATLSQRDALLMAEDCCDLADASQTDWTVATLQTESGTVVWEKHGA